MKIKLNKYLKLFIKLAITVLALYLVFRKVDINEVLRTFGQSNIFLLIAGLTAFIISQLVSSLRLNSFLRSLEIRIPEVSNMKLFLLGMYYNLFLPGGIGGDGYKIYLLNKKFKVKAKQIFWAILLDRVSGLTALVSLGGILAVFLHPLGNFRFIGLLILPLALFANFLFVKKLFKQFAGIIPLTMAQSFMKAILQLICAFFILVSFGDSADWFSYLFLFLISSIVAMFPITIGGVGAREVTFLYGAEILDLNVNIALAVSFMFYLMTVLVSFSGIYFSFNTKKLGIEVQEKYSNV
jgi:hypothetical protein